ncbi:MAG: isocitrate dehydrogenase kinase/phosphatase AceK regulatory subunit, partial [Woeseiaceae bacterium]
MSLPQPAETAALIVNAFKNYNNDFRRVTRRAKRRFETRDWSRNQDDAVERIELYDNSVGRTLAAVKETLADRLHDKSLWAEIKKNYAHQIRDYPDTEFFKTYFSSVTRRVFSTIGVDPRVEFVALDVTPTEHMHGMVKSTIYRNRGETEFLFDEVLAD